MGYVVYRSIPAIREGNWGIAIRASATGWAVTLLAILTWILPAGESARLAVQVARAIREKSAEVPGTIALAEFRDPSVIHALNLPKPVPIVRSKTEIGNLIESAGATIVPLSARELEKIESDKRVHVQVLAELEAMDWDRGKKRKITITLITADPANRIARLPGGSLRGGQSESSEVRR